MAKTNWEDLSAWFFRVAQRRDEVMPRTLYFANAHTLNVACGRPSFKRVLNRGDVVLNDGLGVDVLGWLRGARFVENFNGTDLFPRLFDAVPEGRRLRVFLYGAAPGRAEAAKRNLEARYPRIDVVGTRSGFVHADVVTAVNASRADLLLVGMGNPLQETWIDQHRTALRVGVAAGVGALIDFFSGETPRAPEIVRRMRFEWLYRLYLEPRRLFGRYVIGNPAFLARSVTQAYREAPAAGAHRLRGCSHT